MTSGIKLRERPDLSREEWDVIVAAYQSARVYHRSSWHDVLEATFPGTVVRFEVQRNGRVCGHWCGLVVRKFGARVFGAPLPGSATSYMHPLFSTVPPAGEFLDAILTWARNQRIGMVDVGGDYFETAFEAKGFGIKNRQTYRIDVSGGEHGVWKNLKPAMRNKVRKAEKKGVYISEDTPPGFPDLFSEMLQDVFGRQGLVPTYSPALIGALVKFLGRSGHVKTLTAWHEGEALASMIVLFDEQAAYFWGGASYRVAYPFGANDLINWHALRLAAKRGLPVFDTCGGGTYKEKFGGSKVLLPAGYIAVNPLFGVVRKAVQSGYGIRQAVLGRSRHLWKRSS